MNQALVGHSGFVGSSLLRQAGFDALFRSSDIDKIDGRDFDRIVCAGAPAQKWLANSKPDEDRRNIEALIAHLDTVSCREFVLISTVDVFSRPIGVDEDSPVDEASLHAYGLHRRHLERFVQDRFPNHLIARLPGLVGHGLRKNAIHDLRHNHDLHAIDGRGVFQFYPMANLWHDIGIALRAGLHMLHLTAAPLSISEIARDVFGQNLDSLLSQAPVRYDMRSRYAEMFGGCGRYTYSARESLLAIRSYAQSEPHRNSMSNGGVG